MLELALALNPELGPVIQGTGGLRKIRFALQEGKSGGARIGYAAFPEHGAILLVAIFAKTDQANFSAEQKAKIKAMLSNFGEYLKNR